MQDTKKGFVTYEDFGAVGDGRHDDMTAIAAAHDYANAHRLPVRARDGAVYCIGPAPLSAVVMTDTDWGCARFVIDDSEVAADSAARVTDIFLVPAAGAAVSLPLPPLKAGQTRIDLAACGITLAQDMYVTVTSDERMQYIRFGGNQDSGSPQTDSFVLKTDGSILSGINWDYTRLTSVTAVPIDAETLTLRGGSFTTVANRAECRYTYYARGIRVTRSNVILEGISHTVTGEGENGAPYNGFFSFASCAYAVMRDCRVAGHRIYNTIGSAGTVVSMGSYDINTYAVIDVRFLNVRQDDILNRSLWGVFGSNFCKQIVFDGCVLSRTDAHCGLRDYTVRNSTLGWMGTNTIGFGEMVIENCVCFGDNLIGFRADYGCTWDGNLTVRNVLWVPHPGKEMRPVMFGAYNPGTHDFGYPCTLPHHITIENVTVADTDMPADCGGITLFSDFAPGLTEQTRDTYAEPYPLARPETVTVRGLRTLSGKPYRLCANMTLFPDTRLIAED